MTKAKKIDVFYSFFISDNNEILFGFILIYINYIIINFIIILNEIKIIINKYYEKNISLLILIHKFID